MGALPAVGLGQELARCFLGRHLTGDGVELGAGHRPYPLLRAARIRYADRWLPDENRERFPELGDVEFPVPDIVVNFDVDRLAPLATESCDFVVCSHVIEHLAEPIGFLGEIHRVLRPGGLALLLVPDRRRTFDRGRAPTSLEHLIAEHASRVTEVDDAHIVEFLTRAGEGASFLGTPQDPAAAARWLTWHRERSIHVHCWSEEEFPEVIAHTVRAAGHTWELVDALATDAEGPTGDEFGYVLRRSPLEASPAERAGRFLAALKTWQESGRPVFTRAPVVAESDDLQFYVDAPQRGATVVQPFLLGGWGVDDRSPHEPGIDMIEVWAGADEDSERLVGVAPTGGVRPDVAAVVGERGRTSGYTLSIMGLPLGPCELRVYAHSAVGNRFVAARHVEVTVR